MARNHLRTFVSLVSAVGLVASCGRAGLLPTAPGAPRAAAPYASATGTVTLAIEIPPPKPELARLAVRRVRLQDIDSIDVRASRPGSRQEVLASPNPVALTFTGSTPNPATATLSLPVGNNYVVTVTLLNRSGKAIPGGVLKGAVNVTANTTSNVTVSSATTPTARAIELLAAANPTLAGQVSASQIQALVNQITGAAPYTTKPSRIDPQAIADAIAAGGTVPAAPTAAMTLGTGTITVHVVNAQNGQPVNGASVVVGDPLSALATTNSSGDVTISGVAPGRWPVTAGGSLVPAAVGEAYVIPGQTRAADPQPTVYQPQQVPTTSVSQVLGRNGGTISIPGVLDLNLPAGALTGDRRVRVTTYANADPTRFYGWRVDPQAVQFNVPATVTFRYTDHQLATWGVADPTKPGQIVISQYQGVKTSTTPILPREVALPTTVDAAARTITAQLSQTGVAANPGVLTVQGTGHVRVTPDNNSVSVGGNLNFTLSYDGDPDADISLAARLNGPGVADTVAPPGTDPAGMTVKRAEQLEVGAEVTLPFAPLPPTPSPSPTPTPTPPGTPPTPAPPNEGDPRDIAVPIGGGGSGTGNTGSLSCGEHTITPLALLGGLPLQIGKPVTISATSGVPATATIVKYPHNLYAFSSGAVWAYIRDGCGALVPDDTQVTLKYKWPGGTIQSAIGYTSGGFVSIQAGGAPCTEVGNSMIIWFNNMATLPEVSTVIRGIEAASFSPSGSSIVWSGDTGGNVFITITNINNNEPDDAGNYLYTGSGPDVCRFTAGGWYTSRPDPNENRYGLVGNTSGTSLPYDAIGGLQPQEGQANGVSAHPAGFRVWKVDGNATGYSGKVEIRNSIGIALMCYTLSQAASP